MIINRNNYEEYFLMYVDNELSAADKNMVDAFVAANPDLQEELLMLQQSVAMPDAVLFDGKEKLLKAEAIDAATEEKLLLLLDGELKGKKKAQVLSLISNNSSIQKEWELLQQTKLSAELIVFENKALLYKKEEGKVVPMRWWRVAAAAMLIGFGLWGAVSYFNKGNTTVGTQSETASSVKPAGKNTTSDTLALLPKEKIVAAEKNNNETTAVAKSEAEKKSIEPIKAPAKNNQQPIFPKQEKENNNVVVQEQNKNIPEPVEQNINEKESNKNTIATVPPEKQIIKIEPVNESPVVPANALATNVSLASNKEYNSFDDNNDNDDKRKRSKIGGFFKQVKRVIERKTKINTGSGDEVKIANMSFAMK